MFVKTVQSEILSLKAINKTNYYTIENDTIIKHSGLGGKPGSRGQCCLWGGTAAALGLAEFKSWRWRFPFCSRGPTALCPALLCAWPVPLPCTRLRTSWGLRSRSWRNRQLRCLLSVLLCLGWVWPSSPCPQRVREGDRFHSCAPWEPVL